VIHSHTKIYIALEKVVGKVRTRTESFSCTEGYSIFLLSNTYETLYFLFGPYCQIL